MNILALDTTTSACSVAVMTDEVMIGRSEVMERGHAEALLPMIKAVMNEASMGFPEIDALGVTVGPGAFTGLRIGLAAARGMALAAGIPCVGVTSLEAIAEAIDFEKRAGRALLVALDSKRGDIFAQVFAAAGPPLTAPEAVSFDRLADILPEQPVVVAGTAAAAAVECLVPRGLDVVMAAGCSSPHARDVARVAARRYIAGETTANNPPSPLYLRSPDTGAPKHRGRPKPTDTPNSGRPVKP